MDVPRLCRSSQSSPSIARWALETPRSPASFRAARSAALACEQRHQLPREQEGGEVVGGKGRLGAFGGDDLPVPHAAALLMRTSRRGYGFDLVGHALNLAIRVKSPRSIVKLPPWPAAAAISASAAALRCGSRPTPTPASRVHEFAGGRLPDPRAGSGDDRDGPVGRVSNKVSSLHQRVRGPVPSDTSSMKCTGCEVWTAGLAERRPVHDVLLS